MCTARTSALAYGPFTHRHGSRALAISVAAALWVLASCGVTEPDVGLDPDGDLGAADDAGASAREVIPASAFLPGVFGTGAGTTGAPRPPRAELRPLPGRGVGRPVLTSNNPELVTGAGVLYMNRRSPTRGGAPTRLEGRFGVYLHHLNRSGGSLAFSILVTNPNGEPVTVWARGSGYTQAETGGLAIGASPDYRVSEDWILDRPDTATPMLSIAPGRGEVIWTKPVANGHEVDGRFTLFASKPVHVYVLAAADGTLQKALDVTQPVIDAPGDYRISGTPPPPFGREAGVYAHDTWRGVFDIELPAGPRHVSFMVNTATGGGLSQVQAFPALSHYDGSAAEAVGMYGNVYDLDVGLRGPSTGGSRRVRVAFHSLATGTASRWWDGAAIAAGALIHIRHVPGSESTTLFDGTVAPGAVQRVRLRAMVPGLAAIPQALTVEVF
jgi:hypothetical protein